MTTPDDLAAPTSLVPAGSPSALDGPADDGLSTPEVLAAAREALAAAEQTLAERRPVGLLQEAHARFRLFRRADVVVRLAYGKVLKAVRDLHLYRQDDYDDFDSYLRYSTEVGLEPAVARELVLAYETFIEVVGLYPPALKQEGVTYSHLRVILPHVQCRELPSGQVELANPEEVGELLRHAASKSVAELKRYLAESRQPDALTTRLKFLAVDVIGKKVVVDVEEFVDAPADGLLRRASGTLTLHPATYQRFRQALADAGLLILESGVEPASLRGEPRSPQRRS